MKIKRALLIGIILTGPFALLCCLLLLNSVNPMQLAFITRFTVENQSGQTLRITPIGTRGDEGYKGRLPILMTTFPALPSFRSGGYSLKPGKSVKITYDWDDVNFSEIAVQTEDGSLYEFVVDPNPLLNQYHSPESNHFIISDSAILQPARSHIIDVVRQSDWSAIRYLVLYVGLIACWVLIKQYRKTPSKGSAEAVFADSRSERAGVQSS